MFSTHRIRWLKKRVESNYLRSTQFILRFFNMTIIIAAIDGSVCQLCKSDLRSTKILAANLSRLFRNAISLMEVFNPCAGIKYVFLH